MNHEILSERSIVVTGAAGGLGREVCRCLLSAGAQVTAVDRSLDDAQTLRDYVGERHDRLRFVPGNVLDSASMESAARAAEDFAGPLWGVVCLVGGYTGGDNVATVSGESLDRMIDLNIKASFIAAQAGLRRILAAGRGGRVVTVSSAMADRGAAGHFAYSATKAAVLRLTETIAAEYKGRDVTANAVLPGMIATPANKSAMPDADQSTWVTPSQVADTIAFLLSDAASGVNGSALRVTGRG